MSALQSWTAYLWGDRAVLNSLHAVRIAPESFEERELDNVVREMSIAAGIPKPRIYTVADPAPNAFATGRDPEHASIGVTHGLLELLDREETQGVIAHEVAHIRNHDTRTMTLVAALLGTLVLISDWSARSLRVGARRAGPRGRRGRSEGGTPLALLALVFIIVAPLISRILAMAVSRQREYLADATAAELTRNPGGLARALERIHASRSPLKRATHGTAHLFISDPLERPLGEKEGFLADLLSTHPPVSERVGRLRRMAYLAPEDPAALIGSGLPEPFGAVRGETAGGPEREIVEPGE